MILNDSFLCYAWKVKAWSYYQKWISKYLYIFHLPTEAVVVSPDLKLFRPLVAIMMRVVLMIMIMFIQCDNVYSEEAYLFSVLFFSCFWGGGALILLCEIDLSPKCGIGGEIARQGILWVEGNIFWIEEYSVRNIYFLDICNRRFGVLMCVEWLGWSFKEWNWRTLEIGAHSTST